MIRISQELVRTDETMSLLIFPGDRENLGIESG